MKYKIPRSEDYFRFAIMEYENGQHDLSWEHAAKALLLDSRIEKRKNVYMNYLERIIRKNLGDLDDVDLFIKRYRKIHAQKAPDITVVNPQKKIINLSEADKQVKFVMFIDLKDRKQLVVFSTICKLLVPLFKKGSVIPVFISGQSLNAPAAQELSDQLNIPLEYLYQIKNGSTPEFFSGEPCIWIIDGQGKLCFRHLGFQPGDEKNYQQEILELTTVFN